MSKRATVKPEWLDAMLVAWGMAGVRQALGFAAISPMFRERIPTPARSYEPTGFCGQDWRDLEAAIEALDDKHQLVLIRAYKPWAARDVESILAERYQVGERTWRNWLHEAADQLSASMTRKSGYAEMDREPAFP